MTDSISQKAKRYILENIKKAKQSSLLPEMNRELPQKPVSPEYGTEALVEKFSNELELLEVTIFIENDAESVKDRLEPIIKGKKILSWDIDKLPYSAGDIMRLEDVFFEDDEITLQEQADIGLTGCDFALAETGSLILLIQQGKPRAASLLPPVHIALVRSSSILNSLGDFFDISKQEFSNSHYCSIVTGPSATADIEMTKVRGVHGPGEVIVIIGP